MADQKISELPEANALEGDEHVPVVQDGQTRRVAASGLSVPRESLVLIDDEGDKWAVTVGTDGALVTSPVSPPPDHYTDFSEYTTGELPTGWTTYGSFGSQWEVAESAEWEGGKALTWESGATNDWRACLWDDIGSFTDVEILARISAADGPNQTHVVLRGLSQNSNYQVGLGSQALTLRLRWSGSSTVLDNPSFSYAPDQLVWVRVRAEGDNIRARAWLDGEDEPDTWLIDVTDATNDNGYVGGALWRSDSGDYKVWDSIALWDLS